MILTKPVAGDLKCREAPTIVSNATEFKKDPCAPRWFFNVYSSDLVSADCQKYAIITRPS